nr:hypothetical protein [Trichocoleus desertorum]
MVRTDTVWIGWGGYAAKRKRSRVVSLKQFVNPCIPLKHPKGLLYLPTHS